MDSEKYTSVLHGIIGGVPVPFPVNQGLISGPIKANSKIVYKNSLKVEQSYPKVINSPSNIISTFIFKEVQLSMVSNLHLWCLFFHIFNGIWLRR